MTPEDVFVNIALMFFCATPFALTMYFWVTP